VKKDVRAKTEQRQANVSHLLIKSNFLIVLMSMHTTRITASVCDQSLALDSKMMMTRTHRSSTFLLKKERERERRRLGNDIIIRTRS